MADVYQNLHEIARIKDTSMADIARGLGITPQSFSRVINEQTLTVKRLEAICKILKISPDVLWSENISANGVSEASVKYGTQPLNRISEKTNIREGETCWANVTLAEQIDFLNNLVKDQMEIIKNLSKK